jgi:PadR family transcriptional regulator PadR
VTIGEASRSVRPDSWYIPIGNTLMSSDRLNCSPILSPFGIMYDLTGFQRDLLYVIAGLDEPKGLEIKDELENYYEKEIHHGRLYPNLDTLVDKGLVEKGQLDRRTNYYVVTRRGNREIEDRREWEDQYIDELLEEETSV